MFVFIACKDLITNARISDFMWLSFLFLVIEGDSCKSYLIMDLVVVMVVVVEHIHS